MLRNRSRVAGAGRPSARAKLQLAKGAHVGLAGVGAWAALLGVARPSGADVNTQSVWNGGVGVWSDVLSWTPGIAPQTGTNDAVFAAGEATLDDNFSIGALTLTGGLING